MQLIGNINASYYCERTKPNGPIRVATTGAYVVAEFDERTSTLKWHRVVAAPQKVVIENWLLERFPRGGKSVDQPVGKKKASSALATA